MSAVSRQPSFGFQFPSLSSKISNYFILGLQPHDPEAAMHVGGQHNRTFSRRIYLEMELSFQGGGNAFVPDHKHGCLDVTCKPGGIQIQSIDYLIVVL